MTEKPAAIESITENQAFSQATRIVQIFRKKRSELVVLPYFCDALDPLQFGAFSTVTGR